MPPLNALRRRCTCLIFRSCSSKIAKWPSQSMYELDVMSTRRQRSSNMQNTQNGMKIFETTETTTLNYKFVGTCTQAFGAGTCVLSGLHTGIHPFLASFCRDFQVTFEWIVRGPDRIGLDIDRESGTLPDPPHWSPQVGGELCMRVLCADILRSLVARHCRELLQRRTFTKIGPRIT